MVKPYSVSSTLNVTKKKTDKIQYCFKDKEKMDIMYSTKNKSSSRHFTPNLLAAVMKEDRLLKISVSLLFR